MVRIQGTIHLVLSIITICFHLDLALSIQESNPVLFRIAIATIGITSVIVNIASMVMAYWNMDFDRKRIGEFICVLLHFLQLGPIWRFLKLLVTGDQSDITELSLLRLCHTALQDAILILIEINIILDNVYDLKVMPIMALIFAIISISFSYACVSSLQDSSQQDKKDEQSIMSSNSKLFVKEKTLEWIVHGTWHLFSLQARMLAFAVFVRTTQIWAVVLPTVHLLGHYAIIYVNLYLNPLKQSPRCTEIIQNLLMGYTQLFGYLGRSYQVCSSCVYFIVASVENFVMLTAWFISVEKTSLNTGLFVYFFLCHVIGTVIGTLVNQRDGSGKFKLSPHSSSQSKREIANRVGANQIDTISSTDKETIDVGVDFDTVIEFVGNNSENQRKHKNKLNPLEETVNGSVSEETPRTLDAIDIMKHLISYSQTRVNDVPCEREKKICATSTSTITTTTNAIPISEMQIYDHESSNSRNTNTVISSVSSTIKDNFNGQKPYPKPKTFTNKKMDKSKSQMNRKCNMFERPLPEPPRQHSKSTQRCNNKFERKWRSFSNSPYENVLFKGKKKKSPHFTNRYNNEHIQKPEGNNNQLKEQPGANTKKKPNKTHLNTMGGLANVNLKTVIPGRKCKQRQQLWSHLDWNLNLYTSDSSTTTDYTSLPPRRWHEIYGRNYRDDYSYYYHTQRWRDTCSTCSSTDYFDLDESEYDDTWTWPPRKAGITKESIYGLPRDTLSSKENVTKWLYNIPNEQFV